MNAQTPADKIAASNQIDSAGTEDPACCEENYPQLKSNENFLRLQDELAGTENRIAVERKRYNDSIQEYNTYIGLFPNNIFAGWAGFKRNNDYFQAPEASREVPKVAVPSREALSGRRTLRTQIRSEGLRRPSNSQRARNCSLLFLFLRLCGCPSECGAPARACVPYDSLQSSGGKPIRQNSGDGSVNSNPTSLLLPLFSLINATVHVSSSTVFEFTMETCCPRITGVSIETRHPLRVHRARLGVFFERFAFARAAHQHRHLNVHALRSPQLAVILGRLKRRYVLAVRHPALPVVAARSNLELYRPHNPAY